MEVIKQALDMAFRKGVYGFDDAGKIVESFQSNELKIKLYNTSIQTKTTE